MENKSHWCTPVQGVLWDGYHEAILPSIPQQQIHHVVHRRGGAICHVDILCSVRKGVCGTVGSGAKDSQHMQMEMAPLFDLGGWSWGIIDRGMTDLGCKAHTHPLPL